LRFAIASGTLFSLSAQAAPVAPAASGVQNQVSGDAVKVYHCRNWSGGWHCGGGVGGGWVMAVIGAIAVTVPGITSL